MKKSVLDWITDHERRLIEINDTVWGYTELGLEEVKSSKLLADELEKHHFQVERGVADLPTAFVATYGSGNPVIGIVAEYDALPGLSQKAVSYKDPIVEGGPGHGDAHHAFGTASIGAALAIKDAMEKHKLSGTLKLFGTPAEEILVGKVFMARAGIFNGVDATLAWHPSTENSVDFGSCLALNSAKFTFFGQSAHSAADPERGRSALDAVEIMDVAVNFLREHVIDKARIHYVITDGGLAPNVVPDRAQVWYYVRAPKRTDVEEIYERIVNAAKGAALATGTTVEVNFITGGYEVLPNEALTQLQFKNLELVGPPKFSDEDKAFAKKLQESVNAQSDVIISETISPIRGNFIGPYSTDLGDLSWLSPLTGLSVATRPKGVPNHSWQVTATGTTGIVHKPMIVAAKVIACTAIDLLTQPEELKKVREEFEARTKGFTYKCAVPSEQGPPKSYEG